MNSKSGDEQKKGHHVRKSPNFDSKSGAEQKKGQNDNALMLGRVSLNTWNRPSNALILGRVLGLDSHIPTGLTAGENYALYWPVNAKKNCVVRFIF